MALDAESGRRPLRDFPALADRRPQDGTLSFHPASPRQTPETASLWRLEDRLEPSDDRPDVVGDIHHRVQHGKSVSQADFTIDLDLHRHARVVAGDSDGDREDLGACFYGGPEEVDVDGGLTGRTTMAKWADGRLDLERRQHHRLNHAVLVFVPQVVQVSGWTPLPSADCSRAGGVSLPVARLRLVEECPVLLQHPFQEDVLHVLRVPVAPRHAAGKSGSFGDLLALHPEEGQLEDEVVEAGPEVVDYVSEDRGEAQLWLADAINDRPQRVLRVRLRLGPKGGKLDFSGLELGDLFLEEIKVLVSPPELLLTSRHRMVTGEPRFRRVVSRGHEREPTPWYPGIACEVGGGPSREWTRQSRDGVFPSRLPKLESQLFGKL